MEVGLLRFRASCSSGIRANSVGTEDVNRERAELETAFPWFVIIHPERLLSVRLSIVKGGSLAALRESGRMSCCPRGHEHEGATLATALFADFHHVLWDIMLPWNRVLTSSMSIFQTSCEHVHVALTVCAWRAV
jgi:hypothetical protein